MNVNGSDGNVIGKRMMKWKQKRTREDHLGSEDPIHFTF